MIKNCTHSFLKTNLLKHYINKRSSNSLYFTLLKNITTYGNAQNLAADSNRKLNMNTFSFHKQNYKKFSQAQAQGIV